MTEISRRASATMGIIKAWQTISKNMSKLYMINHIKSSVLLGFFLSILWSGIAYSEPTPVGSIGFSKGLHLSALATTIDNESSPDMCNCVPTVEGALSKRNGSDRFIRQAVSSNPITSVYRAYSSTSNGVTHKAFFASSGDKIYISTDDALPRWIAISSNHAPNQNFNFVTMNGKVIFTGDGLTENVKQYDLANSSRFVAVDTYATDAATGGIKPRGKYQFVANNYYLLANVQISTDSKHLTQNTTYYPSRILFSLLNNSSSMTAQRFIDFNPFDGEEITGLGSITGGSSLPGGSFSTVVDVFKPSAIGELSFTVLNLGGDFTFSESARGVGVIAPKTLTMTPRGYVFLDKSGVLLWDKSTFTRLSDKIKPLIDELIRSGNYRHASAVYYPKKEWWILSIENPQKFPRGRNNYLLVYDFKTGEWFPFCNWQAASFAIADNAGDNGQIFFGSSVDSYLHKADMETRPDDSRRELSIDVMDSSFTWVGSTQDVINVLEGTASVRVSIDIPAAANSIIASSITKMEAFQFGEWLDKSRVSSSDKLSFKAFAHNITSITSLRVDFEINQLTGGFDNNFTSVTITSSAFAGNRVWTKFEIPLSSFPMRPDWLDLTIESVPFANPFNVYGIRFVLNGVHISSVSIDDLRVVEATDQPNRMYRMSKMYDLNAINFKSMGGIVTTAEKSPEASFSMDIYNDFGQKLRTEKFDAEIPQEIAIFRSANTPGISILNSVDYSVKRETKTTDAEWNCLNGEMDSKKIVCGDRTDKARLILFDRLNFSTFSAVYGSYGTGSGNFRLIHEIRQIPNGYVLSDLVNQRIKVHSSKNLGFLKMFGELGNNATNFHQPTGVCGDGEGANFFISDEANNRLVKVNQSSFGFISQVPIDHNTIADTSLSCGDKDVFLAYNKMRAGVEDASDVILERRDSGNLDLLNRATVRPLGVSTGSYKIQGSFALMGRYVFIAFSDDVGSDVVPNPVFYIQKRLRSTLEVISEYATDQRFYSVAGYGLSFNPITKTEQKPLKAEGRYIQIKFYDESIDNYWRLYNYTFLGTFQPQTY